MNKILIIIPEKLPQKLIMRGFCRGFKANKYYVETKFENELSNEILENINPKMILSYGDFSANSTFLTEFLKKNKKVKNLVYFADKKGANAKFSKNTYVFASDRYINESFIYMPLAISSRTYGREFEKYECSISFVANPNVVKKLKILSAVVKTFGHKLSIFCDKKDFDKSIKKMEKFLTSDELVTYKYCYSGFLKDEREISKVLNASKINLNIISQFDWSLNFHAFEVMAAGGFLLTNNAWAANEFFDLARDLETYENEDDLVDKIKFYLRQIDMAQNIALNGKYIIAKAHTFKDRVKLILKFLKSN